VNLEERGWGKVNRGGNGVWVLREEEGRFLSRRALVKRGGKSKKKKQSQREGGLWATRRSLVLLKR